MSSNAANTTTPVAAASTDDISTVRGPTTLASKVQKHVDALTAKIAKLTAENAALKAQLHESRASNSRIRRIPKKTVAATQA